MSFIIQYMFVALCFRKKEVKIEDSYQYVENDEDNEYDEDDEDEEDVDELAREPFAVLLKCPSTGICVCVCVF